MRVLAVVVGNTSRKHVQLGNGSHWRMPALQVVLPSLAASVSSSCLAAETAACNAAYGTSSFLGLQFTLDWFEENVIRKYLTVRVDDAGATGPAAAGLAQS